jgi:uncharacterized membrane protein YkvA (DUF1232 family)
MMIKAPVTTINMEMEDNYSKFSKNYSDNQFWGKLKDAAAKAGARVVYCALVLYYVLKSPGTPTADRAKIIGALGYLILPLDLVPDWIPVVGFTDDLAALLWGVYSVSRNITPEIKEQARVKLSEWFKDYDPSELL